MELKFQKPGYTLLLMRSKFDLQSGPQDGEILIVFLQGGMETKSDKKNMCLSIDIEKLSLLK